MSHQLILMIDDHQPTLQIMSEFLLAEMDCQVEVCNGELEQIELIKRLHPSLVILDLLMPGLSGEQILELMKGDPEIAATPVLLWSASPVQLGRIKPELLQGRVDCLGKPFGLEELLQKIQQLQDATDLESEQ